MSLPDLTHLQFLVIGILMGSEKAGRDIREEMAKHGAKKSSPAFYMMMKRMEDAGFVKGWYVKEDIDGQIVRERTYRVIGNGVRAWEESMEFYARHQGIRAIGVQMNHGVS